MEFLKRCRAEISLDSISYNAQQYKKFLGPKTELLCVVKANCYGHSDKIIVPFLEKELGIRWFAVANITEAVRLREEGIKGNILILGMTPCEYADELVKYDIIQACTELSYAEDLCRCETSGRVRLHCAIDTGMTRIGLTGTPEENAEQLLAISKLEGVKLEGIFTHYACADTPDEESCAYTAMQTGRIKETARLARQRPASSV